MDGKRTDLWVKSVWCQARWRLADAAGSSLGVLIKFNSCSPFNEYQQLASASPAQYRLPEAQEKRHGFCLWGPQCWEKLAQPLFTTWEDTGSVVSP